MEELNEVINKLKNAVRNGKYDMVPTDKNRKSRRKYGLSIFEIEDFLSSIEKEDLVKGPVKDYDFPNESVYIFKKEIIKNVEFYVKIKEKNNTIKILSCYEDEK